MGWGYHTYETVAQKKAKAQKLLAKLQKKQPDMNPVIIEGKKAKTWWGISWNKNLESYADYRNRIGRGSSYLKNGFVLDLQIEPGLVTGIVAGSSMYTVTIKIDKISKTKWNLILQQCSQRLATMSDLAEGKFPKELSDLFLRQGEGLFPSTKEIHLNCSCPDWASMCKHVAAVLYGVGARFDEDPLLFFKLRGINFEDLLKKSIESKMKSMLANAETKTDRMLEESDIEQIFGLC